MSAGSNKKDILKGAGANLSGFIIRLGARLPFLFVVGHWFGADAFGQYVFAVTFVETLSAIAIFGFKRSLFHFFSPHIKPNDTGQIAQIVFHAAIVSIAIALALVGVSWLLHDIMAQIFSPAMAKAALILSPAIFLFTFTEILLSATRAFRFMRYEVFTKSIVEPYCLLTLACLLYFLGFSAEGLLWSYLMMMILSLGSAIYAFFKVIAFQDLKTIRFDFSLMKEIIRFSAPTGLYDLLNLVLLRIDVYILSALTSESTVGIYGMALQIATTVKKIRQSFDPILAPVVSQSLNENNIQTVGHEMAQVSYWILSIQALIVSILFFYGEGLMGLFGAEFVVGGLILSIIVLGDSVNGTFGVSELLLIYKKPVVAPMISAVMLIVHSIMCYVMIDQYGAMGAAISILVTYCVMNILRLLSVRSLFGVMPLDFRILRPLFAAAAMILTMFAANTIYPLISLGGLISLIFVLIPLYMWILYMQFSKDEKARLRKMLGKKFGQKN